MGLGRRSVTTSSEMTTSYTTKRAPCLSPRRTSPTVIRPMLRIATPVSYHNRRERRANRAPDGLTCLPLRLRINVVWLVLVGGLRPPTSDAGSVRSLPVGQTRREHDFHRLSGGDRR